MKSMKQQWWMCGASLSLAARGVRTSKRSFGDRAREAELRQFRHVQREDNKTLDGGKDAELRVEVAGGRRGEEIHGWSETGHKVRQEQQEEEGWVGFHPPSGRINLVEVNVGKLVTVKTKSLTTTAYKHALTAC